MTSKPPATRKTENIWEYVRASDERLKSMPEWKKNANWHFLVPNNRPSAKPPTKTPRRSK